LATGKCRAIGDSAAQTRIDDLSESIAMISSAQPTSSATKTVPWTTPVRLPCKPAPHPASGRKDTHNTFGVSLVYNFN